MNIWILVLGEPLEIDKGNQRLHRSGMLAKKLISRGHSVTFWTSNIDHFRKILRTKITSKIQVEENFKIIQLAGRQYKKNISVTRILHNFDVMKEFNLEVKNEPKPDIIISNYPIIELSYAAIKYAKNNKITTVIDVRDFWPDIFYEVLPSKLNFLGKILFFPWEIMSRYIFKNADFITGISDEAIIWARMKVQQKFNKNTDKSFHLAYRNDKNLFIDNSFLSINKIDVKAHDIYCFFGTLSKRIELKTLCEAAHILESRGKKNIRFVICGNGDMYKYIKSKASMCKTIVAPGWIGKEQIETLLKISKAGFLPYPSSLDFVRSYPNKVGEYLSAGLPILSSIDGAMSNLLNDWNCGITYKNNSPRSLANAIIQLQENKSSYELMSKNAEKCFFEKFDSETVYRDYSIFIESKA